MKFLQCYQKWYRQHFLLSFAVCPLPFALLEKAFKITNVQTLNDAKNKNPHPPRTPRPGQLP